MGFFDKIKDWLGIGGVKVELEIPGQVEKASGSISGKVILTTKKAFPVKDIKVKLEEHWSTGTGENKTSKTFDIGNITIPGGFTISPEETKAIDFTLPFTLIKSENDRMKEQGGLMGTMGKIGAFTSGEKSEYKVVATADVDKPGLDPSKTKDIKLK